LCYTQVANADSKIDKLYSFSRVFQSSRENSGGSESRAEESFKFDKVANRVMARECYDLGLEYGRSEKGKVSVIRCRTGELSKSFKESSLEAHERGTGSWKTTLEEDRFCEESFNVVSGSKC